MPTPTLRCADCEAYGIGNTYPFAVDYSDEHVIIKRYCFPCAAKRGLLRSGPLDHPQSCEIGGCRYQANTPLIEVEPLFRRGYKLSTTLATTVTDTLTKSRLA